ncbi:MAG: thiaminase II [Chloroflexi bacterium]|nr:thiaminase II [Chloroflexota bacterium]
MGVKGVSLSFADQLRQQSAELWVRMLTHPFVEALGGGRLSLGRFRYFMRQDYVFLIEYARVLAFASAKAPNLESMARFARLLDETLNSEMALHRSFCSDFGITELQLVRTRPGRSTTAYTRFLLKMAKEGIEEISAALLPCQWSYDEIGRALARKHRGPADSFHARWIASYDSPEYHDVTEWLINFVDRIGSGTSRARRERMHRIFAESCNHEMAFWDSAWNLGR